MKKVTTQFVVRNAFRSMAKGKAGRKVRRTHNAGIFKVFSPKVVALGKRDRNVAWIGAKLVFLAGGMDAVNSATAQEFVRAGK